MDALRIPANKSYAMATNPLKPRDFFDLYANPDPGNPRVITLIKPSVIFSKNSYSVPLSMPIGLAYIAAVLEKAKYTVKLLDCPGSAPRQIQHTADGRFNVRGLTEDEAIARIDPRTDVIGVTIMFSQEWPYVRGLINKIRAAFPFATIVAGGEHVTAMPDYTLNNCRAIDYLVCGEGEAAMLEFVHKLRSGQPVRGIKGLSWREEGNATVHTGSSPRLTNIEQMPWPAWHLIDLEAYFQPFFTMGIGYGRNIAMTATRGCPYQCTFCSNPTMWTTRYMMRAVKDVVDEIEFNIKTYSVNSIDFYDLTAIVKRDWILDFTAELKRRKLNIVWQLPSGTRSEALDDQVVRALAETGCGFLVFAPESGSVRVLNLIKKRINLVNMVDSIRAAICCGIVVKINFVIGFPEEKRSDIFKTLAFAWKLAWMKANDCNISTFSPYPGSELFESLSREGGLGKITDSYFESLITQFDFTIAKTVCKYVGTLEMLLYRFFGMSLFYILSYVRCPDRLGRLVKCLFQKKPFRPKSLFEQRVYDFLQRKRRGTVLLGDEASHFKNGGN